MSTAAEKRRSANLLAWHDSRALLATVASVVVGVATTLAVVITVGTFWLMRVPVSFPR